MKKRPWWKEALVYQIYPATFYDSNNDGYGDLAGITTKLDYLERLGVNCLWICPFFKSPMDDNGYDVSDYFSVDSRFGTNEDLDELLRKAHQRNIKVIFDLVLNQTSDEHAWFIEAEKDKASSYHNYYIWQDPKYDDDGNRRPPNNWGSFFADSAWAYSEKLDQYYLKIFSKKMPDLNWDNPDCRKAMFSVAEYWLKRGVDGFRIDAIAHLAKDLSFSDSKKKIDQTGFASDWSKFSNLPALNDYLKEFKEKVFSKYDVLTVGEVGGGATPETALKYTDYKDGSINMVFTFDHCWLNGVWQKGLPLSPEKIKNNVIGLKKVFDYWQRVFKGKAWQALYWLNHDHPRLISQYGDEGKYHNASGKALCNTLYLMPGTPFVYNGEEIGMTNVDYQRVEDFNDVWVKNMADNTLKEVSYEELIYYLCKTSRVNARTPFQWNDQKNAGFSQAEPISKVVGNYREINVAVQDKDENSLLNHYRWLLKNRQEKWLDIVLDGTMEWVDYYNRDIIAYRRQLADQELVVIANLRGKRATLNAELSGYTVIHNNYQEIKLGEAKLSLKPWQSLILGKNL